MIEFRLSKIFEKRRWIFGLILSLNAWGAFASQSEFDALVDYSYAFDSVNFQNKSALLLQSDLIFVDGIINTRPVEATIYDRSVLNYTRILWDYTAFSPLNVRVMVHNKLAYRTEKSAQDSSRLTTEEWSEQRGSLIFTLAAKNGFEIIVGGTYHYIPEHEYRVSTTSLEVSTKFDAVAIPIPSAGFVKKLSSLVAGAYYQASAQRDRTTTKTSDQNQEKLIFADTVHNPATVSVFGHKKLGSDSFYGEISLVRGGSGGSRSASGQPTVADHHRIRVSYFKALGGLGLKSTLTYRTYSSSQNKNVTMTSIPFSSAFLKLIFGKETSHAFVGVVGGYGQKGQSSSQIDTDYKAVAFGGQAGMQITF